jgi:hypothetical protein
MRRIHALLATAGLVATPAGVAANPDQSATAEHLPIRPVAVKVLRDRKPLAVNVNLASSATSLLGIPPVRWLRDLFEQAAAESKCT